ncbi:MAG: AAA family ATPase [Marinosulfonomonas sp.]|nr:AAA family ATPase [Marinosulfonomonas sp.]
MSSNAALQPEPAPIVACTVSRDVQNFELLIEDMETELGESWGDLSFEDAKLFFGQPDARSLEFAAIAMDEEDEDKLAIIADLIKLANANGIKVIVIAAEVSPIALHQLLKLGAEEFVPYPLPDGALHDAIERIRAPEPVLANTSATSEHGATGDHNGVVLAVHGLAGGVGATTFAINMAWELANIDKENPPRVCILDLDLQNGSVATYLDLPRRESVYEMLSDTESMDKDAFMAALIQYEEKLFVLTAPSEMLPLDIITSEDVQRIVDAAKANFDYVIIDMPSTVVQWTEVVLHTAHVYFAPLELDMRSAQNALRLIRALKSEELPFEKLRYVLNRAPKFTDMSGKARVKRLAESLDIVVEVLMPDGGKPVVDAGDNGIPLAQSAAKSPLRKEILKLANSVHELNQSVAEGG